ncbi:HalOD1 output domain-containing protein [Natrinema sp. DC36]|uniref:HalOD1 output domain-containing protein n=1 Tax=Natrinema sp. DC36 TaxID=2878680 RepID=UPI001CF08FBA|nr:HalOD1 output domain-containing protein [Natrinema sp. DC36]
MTDTDSQSPDSRKALEVSLLEQSGTFDVEEDYCELESVEYDADEGVYRAIYRFNDASPSIAVVNAVAAVSNMDPLNMEPLYSTVDPDALDSVTTPSETTGDDFRVVFEFHDCEVAVSSTGSLKVQIPESK